MPELPEVECTRTALFDHLVGQKITKITVKLPKILKNCEKILLQRVLAGQIIQDFTRRGKFLTLHLNSGDRLVIHLRMTGCLTVAPAAAPALPHTHLVIALANGEELRYDDLRQFGKFWYFPKNAPDTSGQNKLGPEPNAVTAAYLAQKLQHRGRALKTLLLDQSIVAGIGNIYSDEICFRAGIDPTRPGNSLTPAEITRLAQTIPAVITEFTQFHHTDFATYHAARGKSYQRDDHLQVYGRAGQACVHCGTTLVGRRLDGRSSVFCPQCQN